MANLNDMIKIKRPRDIPAVVDILARTGYSTHNGFIGNFMDIHFEGQSYYLANKKSIQGREINETERNALHKTAYQLKKWGYVKLLQPISRRPRSAVKTISRKEERML